MNDLVELIYLVFGWEIDYDKIIQEYQEKITECQENINYYQRQIDEARLSKEKQRKLRK